MFKYKFSSKIQKQLIQEYSISKLFNKLKAFGKGLTGVTLDVQYTSQSIRKYIKRCVLIKKAIREKKPVKFTVYDEHKGFINVEPISAYRCPLCQANISCNTCPIDIITDSGGCVKTPYRDIDNYAKTTILLKQMEAELFFLMQLHQALVKLKDELNGK